MFCKLKIDSNITIYTHKTQNPKKMESKTINLSGYTTNPLEVEKLREYHEDFDTEQDAINHFTKILDGMNASEIWSKPYIVDKGYTITLKVTKMGFIEIDEPIDDSFDPFAED